MSKTSAGGGRIDAMVPLMLILVILGTLYLAATYVIGLPTFFVFEWLYQAVLFLVP